MSVEKQIDTPTLVPTLVPTQTNSPTDELMQIEEMASIMCTQYNNGKCLIYGKCEDNCSFREDYKRLYNAGYRKQSENTVEVVRCYDCKYCEVVINSIIDEPKYFCTRMVGSMPIDPTDYCSGAKMKGGAE